MLPVFPFDDSVNRLEVNAILFRQMIADRSVLISLSYLKNLFSFEFGKFSFFTTNAVQAAFLSAVLHVLKGHPKEQMCWVHTRRRVAVVKNILRRWVPAEVDKPRESVGKEVFLSKVYYPVLVPITSPSPFPAQAEVFDSSAFTPESVKVLWFKLREWSGLFWHLCLLSRLRCLVDPSLTTGAAFSPS